MASIHLAITKSGNKIEGDCRMTGREGTIVCSSVSHGVSMPYSYDKAHANGESSHGPLTIVKPIDKSSPALYQSLLTGETLAKAELTWYERSPQGKEEPVFRQTLENALVVSVSPRASSGGYSEEVAIAYEKVSWTYEDGGISCAYSLATREV